MRKLLFSNPETYFCPFDEWIFVSLTFIMSALEVLQIFNPETYFRPIDDKLILFTRYIKNIKSGSKTLKFK